MLKINYDELAVEGLKDVLINISSTCKELEIDFFIVGAIARNIWLASHGENPTGTKDIDFGVYVPNVEKYNLLKEALINNYNYVESRENDFCLFTPDGKQIDLLPFGEIEQDGQVMIKGKGYTQIKPDGFEETYNLGLQEVKIGEEKYSACSIPAIVILKMIAYDDRPERRIKDVKDISDIFIITRLLNLISFGIIIWIFLTSNGKLLK
jgi:predicted nucleotidyltransferase